MKQWLLGLMLITSGLYLHAQDQPPKNWFHLDLQQDNYPGVSTEKTYRELIKTRRGEEVIVAVIDSGVDAEHEDLQKVIWVNADEIPDNGKDDDQNGYVDDLHGWNFIGNAKGENINYDNLEITRLYVKYKERFEGKSPDELGKKERKLYEDYRAMGETIEKKSKSMSENAMLYGMVKESLQDLKKDLDKPGEAITLDDLKNYQSSDPLKSQIATMAQTVMEEDGFTFEAMERDVEDAYEYFYGQANYYYNTEFDPRALVGDDFSDPEERYYGNNDVEGPDAEHGTHVAGIIGAIRNNGIGMDGVANNVRIMSIRTVPNGDERDKDVANAIRYAVDNGASIINMSFGKGYSPRKAIVDEAVKYAMKKDVLLVHAAGNDGKENNLENNFPNDRFDKKGLLGPRYAKNWIEVGAFDWQGGEHLAADFSNYSADLVDVFAPGTAMYSTVPDNAYRDLQGTSMAAPVVTGIAAVLRSYFPDLTAPQVKQIIMDSAVRQKGKTILPGESEERVSFKELSVTGGLVNLYEAFKLASRTKGKKKGVSRNSTPASANGAEAPGETAVP
jgi:subtilisin family serine protease